MNSYWSYNQETSNFWSKLTFYLCFVTLKFDGWPWKHRSYATLSCVHHSIAIYEFKLELKSGKSYIGFWSWWPWPSTSDLDLSHGHHFCQWQSLLKISWWYDESNIVKQGESEGFDSCDQPSNLKLDSNRQFFHPCDSEIWWMTLKNNRALLLYYVKLCASFQIHWWIHTGFTVQKLSIQVEIGDMFSCVTLKFDGWPWKTIGHLFYATSSFVQQFLAIGEFKLELHSGNAQSGSNSTFFRAVLPWNLTDDLAKQ